MPLYPPFPAATSSVAGIAILDGTAADITPDGVQGAGAVGKAADAGHTHASNSPLSLYTAVTGTTAETVPGGRYVATAATTVLVTQQLYLVAIGLPKGLQVSNITFVTKSTATGGAAITHAWYLLSDLVGGTYTVRAVSADQATSTTFMAAANTPYTLAMGTPFTTAYGGLYYVGVMVECGTMPNLATAGTPPTALTSAAPVPAGTSGAATQTTPPAVAATLTAPAAAGGFVAYAYTS